MFGNWIKTSILMAGIVALFGAVGGMLGGQQGMLIALVFAGGMNVWAYWFSDKMVLRMYKARQVDAASSPYLYNMVKELAGRAGLPMPKGHLIDEAQPNAFATGRNPEHAAVAATTGIMQMLSERELRGVMAHELAHVKNRDIPDFDDLRDRGRRDLFAGPVRDVLRRLARWRGSPQPDRLDHHHDSRAARRHADPDGDIAHPRVWCRPRRRRDLGDPQALASALAKIDAYARGIPMHTADAHPETAQMMIMNPLSGGGLRGLFSTHPATEERIARLRAMARTA